MRLGQAVAVGAVIIGFCSLSPGAAAGQDPSAPVAPGRLRRSIEGPVTREAVARTVRSLVPVSAADRTGDAGRPTEVSVMLRIEFAFDSAELTPAAVRDLDQVAAGLLDAEIADVPIVLEGHTDATGPAAYNRDLSRRRADAVLAYLIRHGIAGHRLRAVGHGADRPLEEVPTTDGRQRRVEIVFTF